MCHVFSGESVMLKRATPNFCNIPFYIWHIPSSTWCCPKIRVPFDFMVQNHQFRHWMSQNGAEAGTPLLGPRPFPRDQGKRWPRCQKPMGKPQENPPQMLCVFLIYIRLRGLWGCGPHLPEKKPVMKYPHLYPPAIKSGNGKSSIMDDFLIKTSICGFSIIFRCHLWLPKGI